MLALSVVLGVLSAIVYGTSTVVQYSAVHDGSGSTDARGLLRLLKNPQWLFTVAGDGVGFLLQVGALSTGPVVLIQPLVVLTLPVALIVAFFWRHARPTGGDYLGVAAVVAGLTVFLLMVSKPGKPKVPDPWAAGAAVVVLTIIGGGICLAIRNAPRLLRCAVYGGIAGSCFGTLGVLVNTISHRIEDHGFSNVITSPGAIVDLVGMALLGITGVVLTQLSYQIGVLGATLPASLTCEPGVAVILGVILLDERIPHSPVAFVIYGLCLVAIVAGAIRLVEPATSGRRVPEPGPLGAA